MLACTIAMTMNIICNVYEENINSIISFKIDDKVIIYLAVVNDVLLSSK